ncbi:MAG: hypothetical protein U0892_23615 [Pirellulales bacterium]
MMSKTFFARANVSGSSANCRDLRRKGLTFVLLLVSALAATGCGSHPEVTGPESLVNNKRV